MTHPWGGMEDFTSNGQFTVVSRTNSPFGSVWWLSDLDELFPDAATGNVLWVTGAGDTMTFVKHADGTFASPELPLVIAKLNPLPLPPKAVNC